jgi:uncharacterized membrane protein
MAVVSSSVLINRPIREIFDYVANPQNGPKYNPFVRENSNIKPDQPCLGQTFNWRYLMRGIEMKGSAKVIEYVASQKYAIATTGDIMSTWTFLFEEQTGGTKVTLHIEYEIGQSFVKKIVNLLILDRFNQKALEDALENLKAQLEA